MDPEELINPLGLSPLVWVGGYVAKSAALWIWDLAVTEIVKRSGAAKLPTTGLIKFCCVWEEGWREGVVNVC
eukprot:572895-Amorphochlora_amoeboformis.AAC.1